MYLSGLGTWYLPFGDSNSESSSSAYLDCDGGYHNGVSHNDKIVPDSNYVIFFQWMPDDGYEGDVTFKGVVKRGSRIYWEKAIGIKVFVKDDHNESDDDYYKTTTSIRNEECNTSELVTKARTDEMIRISTEQTVETISEIDVDFDTTRWSSNKEDDVQLSSSTPEYPAEPYERLEAEHGGWTEARNFGVCLTTVPLMTCITWLLYCYE